MIPSNLDILVIDDYELTCQIVVMTLRKVGFNVDAADSGYKGLAKILDKNYALVLLDLNLPDVDGLELAQKIRQTNLSEQPKIVAFTGRDISNPEEYLAYGVNAVLTKPFVKEHITSLIIELLDQKNS